MSKTLRRPLGMLLLAACSVVVSTGYSAATQPFTAVVAIGRQAGSVAAVPACGACWGGG